MSTIQSRSILCGLSAFAVLYFGITYLSNTNVRDIESLQSTLPWLNLGAFLAWVISGYITGAFAKSKGFINGALFGVFSIAVVSLVQFIFGGAAGFKNSFNGFYYWIVVGMLLGGLGGLLWDIYAGLRNKSL